ncbi:hypothetical protein ABI59_19625 [Acidobacteria bacterium Mor1]|nr:hypothetical protein ABI59_19625 [Acidobacteria bacterium Mor1]
MLLSIAALLLAAGASAGESRAVRAYKAMGLATGDILSSTVLQAKVIPGEEEQLVAVTTYFTGKKDKARAVNVRFDVWADRGGRLESLYHRDFGAELEGHVDRGDLQLVDLDRDDVQEMMVSFDDVENPVVLRRVGELLVYGSSGFRAAWEGPVRYDATRAARGAAAERRDLYERELDVVSTLRTRGVTLFFSKKVYAVAGQRLERPKVVQETFPLKPTPEGW